jgi:hypothetical protein
LFIMRRLPQQESGQNKDYVWSVEPVAWSSNQLRSSRSRVRIVSPNDSFIYQSVKEFVERQGLPWNQILRGYRYPGDNKKSLLNWENEEPWLEEIFNPSVEDGAVLPSTAHTIWVYQGHNLHPFWSYAGNALLALGTLSVASTVPIALSVPFLGPYRGRAEFLICFSFAVGFGVCTAAMANLTNSILKESYFARKGRRLQRILPQ